MYGCENGVTIASALPYHLLQPYGLLLAYGPSFQPSSTASSLPLLSVWSLEPRK